MPENWIVGVCQCQNVNVGPDGRVWVGVTWHSPNCGGLNDSLPKAED